MAATMGSDEKPRCCNCGRATCDLYYRNPGTGFPCKDPWCAECYERGWAHYWRAFWTDRKDIGNWIVARERVTQNRKYPIRKRRIKP